LIDWKKTVVSSSLTLREVISNIDSSGLQIALVVNSIGHLIGTVTDGDIRRALLKNLSLDCLIVDVMNAKPITATNALTKKNMVAYMYKYGIHHLPIIDDLSCLVGLEVLDSTVFSEARDNLVVIMAGGLGKRLYPLTKDCPKPLLNVGGKPILESIVEGFAEQGFVNVFISVNYMAEMIKDYFHDGAKWGVSIRYLEEDKQLGTAGALSLLPETPKLPIIVMNGDLLTKLNYANLLEYHQQHNACATMVVRDYEFEVPFGVVHTEELSISSIEEKPIHKFRVNAGIYVLSPNSLKSIPFGDFFDMPSLFSQLALEKKRMLAFPLREFWIDIGRQEEFDRAQHEWVNERI
jgi:dTDP-glucose pyrophosphorylase/predicted transcriptional regulator